MSKLSTTVSRDVNKAKSSLIKKAQKKGLWENFGQNEVRDIRDKHDYNSLLYGTSSHPIDEERQAVRTIDGFYMWCLNFDLSQLK